ncbi:MAG: plasmid pRiA4b ORF-3 family protein [Kofleriaceae bacterium]
MATTTYELDVRLSEIEPPIWRRIELAGSATLDDVHFAIQVAMGWTNSHLHQFIIDGTSYGMANVDGAEELGLEDERGVRLDDLVGKGDLFVYEYDFGDGWRHEVTVKNVKTVAKAPKPRCTAGARACPPEDCGGSGGYATLLRALADPSDEDDRELVEWAGNFKPERFAIPKTGRDLGREMKQLEELTDQGDDGELFDDDDPRLGLPAPLVDAVLALEPMQRASLSALIAGSLANELLELRTATTGLLETLKTNPKLARASRRRTRS